MRTKICQKHRKTPKATTRRKTNLAFSPLRWYKLQQPTPLTDKQQQYQHTAHVWGFTHGRLRFGKTNKRVPSLYYHKYSYIIQYVVKGEPSTQKYPLPCFALHLDPSWPLWAWLSRTERTLWQTPRTTQQLLPSRALTLDLSNHGRAEAFRNKITQSTTLRSITTPLLPPPPP